MATGFKTQYSAHEAHKDVFSVSGEKDRPNYKPQYNEAGAYELVEDGVFHSYDDIQAWLPTCDMGTIIERYIRTGDTELLNRRAAFYADTTDLPTNYAELHNMLQHADEVFMSLPVEVREEFGHNPAGFYSDGAKANEVISKYLKSKEEPPVPVPTEPVITPAPAPAPVEPVKGEVVNE